MPCAFASAASAAICAAEAFSPSALAGRFGIESASATRGHVFEEPLQVGAGVLGLELPTMASSSSERVLHARFVLNVLGGAQSRQVPCLFQDRFQAGCGGFGAGNLRQVVHEAHELGVLLDRGGTGRGCRLPGVRRRRKRCGSHSRTPPPRTQTWHRYRAWVR